MCCATRAAQHALGQALLPVRCPPPLTAALGVRTLIRALTSEKMTSSGAGSDANDILQHEDVAAELSMDLATFKIF